MIIRPDRYFENTLNILRHVTKIEQERLGNPVNKTLWNAAPAVVNAYYSRNKNQISELQVKIMYCYRDQYTLTSFFHGIL